jgi:hypothetical protein
VARQGAMAGVNLGGQALKQKLFSIGSRRMSYNSDGNLLTDDRNVITENDKIAKNNIILRTEDYEIEFLDAKIDVKKSNKIINTPLVNRAGSVKEMIQAINLKI